MTTYDGEIKKVKAETRCQIVATGGKTAVNRAPHLCSVDGQTEHLMASTQDQKSALIRSIFTERFGIGPDRFDWDRPLEELDERFKLLGNLVFLEQLLQEEFHKEIPLLENICTAFHTPGDILELVANIRMEK